MSFFSILLNGFFSVFVMKKLVKDTTKTQDVFKKYTVNFAINSKGTVAFEIYEKGGIDSKRLKSFLEHKVLKNQKKKLIILDNASSHRNDIIKEK